VQPVEHPHHQVLGPLELEREHAEADEHDGPARPRQRDEREAAEEDHERDDREADPVGLAALDVLLAPPRQLLGQRAVLGCRLSHRR